MKLLRTGAASVNSTPLDWEGNSTKIIAAIEEARSRKVELLLLPELALSGYGCEDFFIAAGTHKATEDELNEIISKTEDIVVAVGIPFCCRNRVYNGVALIADRDIVGIVGKQNLANDGIHYENRWFQPWEKGETDEITLCGTTVPVGDLLFNIDGVRIGFEICEDAWVAQRPGRSLAEQGVDIILNPSASHFSFGKHDVRKRFVMDGSRAFDCAYVYANLLGNEAGRIIYDGGNLIAAKGELLCESPRFTYNDTLLIDRVIDVNPSYNRKTVLVKEQRSKEICLNFTFQWEETFQVDKEEIKALNKYEEFSYAATLGLFDYMRKSRSKGVMLSLSGGADSSAVAVIVWLMYSRGMNECPDIFREKLSYFLSETEPENYMRELLCTLYQATENSGETTFNAAKTLAEAIRAEFNCWSVENDMASYLTKVENVIGRKTTWENDDIALQNIQARIRVPGLWMLANIKGSLLVSTSNRSEAAVGYATMDGDTSGGISPLAGIDKPFLLDWLKWVEEKGIDEIGPLPQLSKVTQQKPTAELRPKEAIQTDEDDLMPYAVLEQLELLAIKDKKYPMEIMKILGAYFPDYTEKERALWIVRFFRLWSQNQWKRERYAPSFHFDDINLDPKSFCRFPILSGGFRKEIELIEKKFITEETK